MNALLLFGLSVPLACWGITKHVWWGIDQNQGSCIEWVDMVDDQLCNQYDPPHIGLLGHGHTLTIIASDSAEFSIKIVGFLWN